MIQKLFRKPDTIEDWLMWISIAIASVLVIYFLWVKWLHLLLDTDGLAPHGYCFLWNPALVTLHVSSDSLIGLAYVAISGTLLYFVIKNRRDLPFNWIFVAFGVFIIACGITHFLEVWTLWNATYWLSGSVKVITAVASVATAIVLPTLVPKATMLIETAQVSEERKLQLEQANDELARLNAQIEEALQQSEQRYGQLAEALPLLIWTAQPNGAISYYNQRWFNYTGVKPQQGIQPEWYSILHPDEVEHCKEQWHAALRDGTAYTTECRFQDAEGSYKWHLVRTLPVKNIRSRISSWVGTATDIDAQKQLQEELRQSEQRKDSFLSMASHELKTPITSIKAFVQILQKMLVKEGQTRAVQHLEKMEAQVNKLIKLITEFLDISKIQTGQLTLNLEEFAVDTFVYDVVAIIQQTNPTHTITIHGNALTTIRADKNRLEQVLINMLTNAIKYSPQSQNVDVFVSKEEQQVKISVRDYGVGIPKEHQDKIFERFYRVYGEHDQNFPGLGIGLYIAWEIMQRHSGKIWVESIEFQGSTFSFSLPIQQPQQSEESHESQAAH